MKIVTLCLVLLLAGCGKVGEPLPPFVRIPEAVTDLTVRQSGNDLIVTWTNPARYIDGSAATDLARVQIRSDDAIVATVEAAAPAQSQSVTIPLRDPIESPRSFTIIIETTRGRMSQVSNAVPISPAVVPGRVIGLTAVVDQRRIFLTWEKPREHPELADAYRVNRLQPTESRVIMETRYEDTRYRPGEKYTYEVTAMRGTVPGVGPESVTVSVEDKTPPQVPSGLDILVSDTGAFVTWSANSETDLAGYRVFRDRMPVSEGPLSGNSFFDGDYRPGVTYAVSAVDEFGNESPRSPDLRPN
jgi:hypothetical protein